MGSLVKYREELDVYEVSFAARLTEDETIMGAVVTISLDGIDRTTDVLTTATVWGPGVRFQVKPAEQSAQPAGLYQVRVKVNTSTARILVGVVDLVIR
jgi:hypothetical protein